MDAETPRRTGRIPCPRDSPHSVAFAQCGDPSVIVDKGRPITRIAVDKRVSATRGKRTGFRSRKAVAEKTDMDWTAENGTMGKA